MLSEDIALPIIRNDIQLNEAPSETEGAPNWTLYDPAANKYYKIGWLEFECLVRFKNCQTVNQLLFKIKNETTLEPELEMIKSLVQFLVQHNLIYATDDELLKYFETQREKIKRPWWEKLIHSYLFFTLPLFKPQNFLNKTYPFLSPLFTRPFIISVFLLLGYGIFLSIQRFDEIANTFINYLNFEGVVLFLGTTILVKIIHELGHAYTATKYGVPITIIGVAFIVLYPILYTETTNTWKLKNRRDRLVIAAGGLMAELTLAAIALILWHILSPGMAQSLCFMIAIVSMLASLMVNLNPLMKFDGYYLFSDLVGIDNLQDRSFAFSKWRLRKWLWGWDDPTPEVLPANKQKLLISFGFAVWQYRFFLYLGIALLVYHLFFQPLGFILMLVELVFFLALPAVREIRVWLERREDIIISRRGKISLSLMASVFALLFIPIQHSIEIPAVLHAKNYVRFYAPIPSKIEEVMVEQGQKVEKGDLLFRLSSYNLDHNINITRQRLKDLEGIRESSQATPELANKRVMIDSEIENTRKELEGLFVILEQLNITAPFSGTINILDSALKSGQWVSTKFMLALLADDESKILSGYVSEQDSDMLSENYKGKFYAEYSLFKTFDVVLDKVEKTGAIDLFWAELSSKQGGPIPSETNSEGRTSTLPRYTVYAVQFNLAEGDKSNLLPNFIARGAIHVAGKRESFAKILIKKGISSFVINGGN